MIKFTSFIVTVCALTAAVQAAETAPRRSRWHVEAAPNVWLNARVTYGARLAADPSGSPKSDRVYDDGFNRVDASGNVGDGTAGSLPSRTGYFGYANDSQVDLKSGTLAMHQLRAADGNYLTGQRPALRPGLDLTLRYSFRPDDLTRRDWGMEVSVGFARFRQATTAPVAANLRLLTDTYSLGGVVPQRAPYAGRFSPLPGDQRIGDMPTRSLASVIGTASGRQAMSANTTVFRVAGWWEIVAGSAPAHSEGGRWSVMLRGGPALISTRASFSVDEQLLAPGYATPARVVAGGAQKQDDLGAFLGVKARRALGQRSALLVWGDYLHGSHFTVADTARYARLDLTQLLVLGGAIEIGW